MGASGPALLTLKGSHKPKGLFQRHHVSNFDIFLTSVVPTRRARTIFAT